MSNIEFVGKHKDGDDATLFFNCENGPSTEFGRRVAVSFDIESLIESKLHGNNGEMLPWYKPWKMNDEGKVVSIHFAGNELGGTDSVASIYQLKYLEMKGLRNSTKFLKFVESMNLSQRDMKIIYPTGIPMPRIMADAVTKEMKEDLLGKVDNYVIYRGQDGGNFKDLLEFVSKLLINFDEENIEAFEEIKEIVKDY